MKIFKKILIGIMFFGFLLTNTFAFEAKLKVNEDNVNNIVDLQVEIKSEKGGEIKVKNIKGINNFDIIGQSQSQSSNSSVVIMNGKTQQKTITTVKLNLNLKPKKSGSFEIGPATIEMGSGSIKTNSVLVKVNGNNLGNTIIPKINNKNTNPQNINNKNNKIEKKIENEDNINIEDYKNNNYELYILLLILTLSGIGFYIFFNKKTINQQSGFSPFNKEGEKEKQENEEDFEQKTKKIVYPKIADENFIDKITEILKDKLAKKYNIENIKSKTFSEILNSLGEDENIKEVFDLINKTKYSNIITNNEKILEEVKKIK